MPTELTLDFVFLSGVACSAARLMLSVAAVSLAGLSQLPGSHLRACNTKTYKKVDLDVDSQRNTC